jgi:nicotinamidase-related amidase
MNINKNDTAVVVIDPQNDVLSEKGKAWDLVGTSVKENKTVENIERIFQGYFILKRDLRKSSPKAERR